MLFIILFILFNFVLFHFVILFNRFAHSAGPHQLVVGLLGCCVAVFLSCCPAVLPSSRVVFFLCCRVVVSLCHRVVVLLCSCLDILPPPSHQQTTPRLPTTPIHLTHHKYQKTLKKKGSKDDKMTSTTWLQNEANSLKKCPGGAQNGPKMDPKSRKRRSTDQNGTRWRP